jgi:hypothetical protein
MIAVRCIQGNGIIWLGEMMLPQSVDEPVREYLNYLFGQNIIFE